MQPARFVILAALMVSIGGQWMVLQGVAWLGMAVTYSVESGSFSSGLSKTFDGEHPCPLCRAVKKASQEERAPATPATGKSIAKTKAELCLDSSIRLFPPQAQPLPVERMDQTARARTNAPDGPPPRLLKA